jgi:uncharacterized membrane protein YkoI
MGEQIMIKKSTRILVLLAVMLTVITVVALALVASDIPSINNSKQENLKNSDENSNFSLNSSKGLNGSDNIKISPVKAQKIAETFIKEPGAKVGIPQLNEVNGQMVYTVPIQINGTNVGEITINALTGENMGGAGGVP